MFDHVLGRRGERVTIVGATSGDTGSAAIDGVKGCANVDIVILYPTARTSDVQRRQMTTVDAPNVHAVADRGHVRRLPGSRQGDVQRRAVPRAHAAVGGQLDQLGPGDGADRLLRDGGASARRAGHGRACRAATSATSSPGGSPGGWARRSTTSSSPRTPTTSSPGSSTTATCRRASVVPTLSPSMDIQVSSNFERLLFEMNGRDGGMTAEQLQRFRATGRLACRGRPVDRVHRRGRSGPAASTTTRRSPRSAASTRRRAC